MCRDSIEQSACAAVCELARSKFFRGLNCLKGEAQHEERVTWNVYRRPENFGQNFVDVSDKWRKPFLPGGGVTAERRASGSQRSEKHGRVTFVEGMSQACGGVDPLETVRGKRQRPEER
jgi:hypothetical protein